MALITDPDSLNQAIEVTISTAAKTIDLAVAGNLSNDGVTLKALYSFLKEEWLSDSALIKFPFPMTPITDESFELKDGWDFSDDTSRYLIRTGGWTVKTIAGATQEIWAGIVSLGSVGASDQLYFQQATSGAAADFQLTGAVNQAVKIYGDATHGNFDYTDYFKIFTREYAKAYQDADLDDIGVTTMTSQVYRFPVANSTDLKITHNDTAVSTTAPYTGMSITWYATPQSQAIGGSNYDFHVIINGNGGTAEQIYEFVQYQLRQNADIDAGAGTVTGETAASLLRFVGDTLYTLVQDVGGVFITGFDSTDINRIYFADDTGTNRSYPYTASLTIQFGDNLQNDASAKYWVFFTNDDAGGNLGYDFGTANAILVDDASSVDMTGTVSAATSVAHTFAYDSNVQRGTGSSGTDAPITVVAIGLNTAQYVKATGMITRSTANTVSLVSALERNYTNPA